jgi:antitoxin (DNA-binding transcriptional repressor) of toxin-antitoxin stability system
MGETPANVSADSLESWNDAVRRGEHGETVAVVAHGEHVADAVPSGELDRLRETIEVLSDHDLMRAVQEGPR